MCKPRETKVPGKSTKEAGCELARSGAVQATCGKRKAMQAKQQRTRDGVQKSRTQEKAPPGPPFFHVFDFSTYSRRYRTVCADRDARTWRKPRCMAVEWSSYVACLLVCLIAYLLCCRLCLHTANHCCVAADRRGVDDEDVLQLRVREPRRRSSLRVLLPPLWPHRGSRNTGSQKHPGTRSQRTAGARSRPVQTVHSRGESSRWC